MEGVGCVAMEVTTEGRATTYKNTLALSLGAGFAPGNAPGGNECALDYGGTVASYTRLESQRWASFSPIGKAHLRALWSLI
jgi:hypothetical protein